MELPTPAHAERLLGNDAYEYHVAEILRETAELIAQTRQIIQQARSNLWYNPELTAVMLDDLEQAHNTAHDCTAQVANYLQTLSVAELYLPRYATQSEGLHT
ncbi:MAG: hypothetical protein CV045_13825 [Cyanobacteria bacterium M5B4]|nr:MAG: hypothetical protein CV045_13825 [Cyanobacteria bacterium M5B4]